jgi:phosphoglucosamine mutase
VTEVERQLGDQGRVLLRASGTEPLVRIMVEGAEANLVSQLAEQLAQIIKKLMSA